jgi:hypothetical protein
MKKMISTNNLKQKIELLETSQAVKLQGIKEDFLIMGESLKPINLAKGALKKLASPGMVLSVTGIALSLATGYFTKRLIVGASVNGFRKLAGTVLQVGITSLIAKNAVAINSFGRSLFQVFRKKRT